MSIPAPFQKNGAFFIQSMMKGVTMLTTNAIIIYITTKDAGEARTLGRKLVTERLVACANILDGMQSLYHWEGKLCEDREAVLICKTRQSLLDEIVNRVKKLHTYTCPCIVAYPIAGGSPEYLAWIEQETKRPEHQEPES